MGTGGFNDMSTLKPSSQKWPINIPGSSVRCWTEMLQMNHQNIPYLYHLETVNSHSNINSVILHQSRTYVVNTMRYWVVVVVCEHSW